MSASASASAAVSSAAGEGLSVGGGNPAFKIVGISLAIGSGAFIGASFVVKKLGLIRATAKYGNQTGEGHAYLKSPLWWTGMTMMIVGEVCNFVAYAFTEAILVTPMGALSVVICAVLSHFFLKESLNFFGWIGCTLCVIGATLLALNVPEQRSVTTIAEFKKLFLAPGFLVWGSLCIVGSLVIIFYVAPRWGKKNMMPYISVCSMIGGISVSCTQGLGASIVTSIQGHNQVKNWFFWFLLVFVVITLLVEINYLNKALELFNAAMVVPVYFVIFTSATLVTSFILYQGLKASAVTLITMVMSFFVICLGITLLQMSKVDPKQLTKLDRKASIFLEATHRPTEETEKGSMSAMEEPGMDALRGGFGAVGSIIRARSINRKLSMSSTYGQLGGHHTSNLSTHGMESLQRYQLNDNPMPHDAMDQVSLHTKSPVEGGSSFSHNVFPPKSKSSLTFEEADVVHQYGYGRGDEAVHGFRQHPHLLPPMSNLATGRRSASNSISSIYPPVVESPDEYADLATPPLDKRGRYLDPYNAPGPSNLSKNPPRSRSNSPGPSGLPSTSKLANMFHFSTSADPSKHQVRGGTHRGTKDYPQLKTKGLAPEEMQERRGLVSDSPTDVRESTSYDDEPQSAVTDESMGHVFKATVRPLQTTTGRASGDYRGDGDITPKGSYAGGPYA